MTKESILKVTAEMLVNIPFEDITIHKISTKANIAVGLINYHFGNKDNLINFATKRYIDDLIYDCDELILELPPLELVKTLLKKICGNKSDEQLYIKIYSLTATLQNAFLNPAVAENLFKLDFFKEEERNKLVDLLVETIIVNGTDGGRND